MARKFCLSTLVLCSGLVALALTAQDKTEHQVRFSEEPGKIRIEIGGKHFSDYIFEGYSRPILFPILGPGGVQMTRSWPMREAPDEQQDHPHHKSFWWAHGSMNGVDFWSEGKDAGKTVHEKFLQKSSGPIGTLKTSNRYVSKTGELICRDERTLRFYPEQDGARYFDFEITLHASEGDLTFGDTKEGTLALRLAETMRLKGKVGQGHIVNSEGVRDGDTWGKRAKWVDYYGPSEGKTVGVAIFDHPSNPRHPTWWHVRDYGLFAANPFGIHDFEKKGKGAGDLVVKAGEKITFRYRLYFHPGDEKEGRVAEAYAAYLKSK